MRYDLAVIGSGAAGFAAAIAARRMKRTVVMVEQDAVGGTCVNSGCVPSKALLAAAQARHVALDSRFPGIHSTAGELDFGMLIDGKDELLAAMRTGKYVDLAAEHGWQILHGRARFVAGPALEIDGHRVTAEHYVIATGSAPWAPSINGLERAGFLTSATAMELESRPDSLIVIGGNSVGLEQGQLFARLGTNVTIVELADRLAPVEEPEISAAIAGVFADEGITLHTATRVTEVRRDGSGYTLTTREQLTLTGEHLLVATGRRPVTNGLNLEAVGVKVGEHGQIVTDGSLRSDNPRIWAAGDVTGHPQFVYVAAAHGALAAGNALNGAQETLDYAALPRVTFTTPAIATAGMTEAQATAAGIVCDCRTLPLEYVPRAIVNRDTRGLIKLVAEAGSGRLLGVHAIAAGAGDVIAAAVYALRGGLTVQQIADTWAPYLTMGEGLRLAAQTYSRDVTKLSCCAS